MDFRIDEFDVFEKGDIMETIRNVEINQLHDFKNHPFKVEVNTELCELMKSIEKEGVLVQLLVRTNPYGDGYEIISGHRRKEAAIWAGEMKIPVVIRELDDDQAVVAMVDSNLYRENLKPSEKAFAYKMKLDAMKHQGKRLSDDSLSDNGAEVLAGNEANHMTSAQVGPKCDTDGNGRTDNLENESNEVIEEHYMINSNELLARQVGESVAQIKRYIRLTNLIPKILSTEGMAVIEERIRQEAGEEARQEANKEVMSMVGSMLVAMQSNKGAIAIIQQQADTDDNAESDDDFYDDVIAQSALNWMEKD